MLTMQIPASRLRTALVSIIVALLCSAVPSLAFENSYAARIIGVTDGDSVTAQTSANQQMQVRLAGIDAPEEGQPFGSASREHLRA
jgi:micrococcal nuclease